MKDDPWDWTRQSMQAPPPMQSNNSLNVPASGQTQAPPPMQGAPGFGQMAGNIIVARGVNKGIDSGLKAGDEYFNKPKHDPTTVPVEDRIGTPPNADATADAGTRSLDTAVSSAGGSTLANNVLPAANQAVSTEGVDMAFQAADQAQLMSQGLSATQAASTVAPLSEAAATGATIAEGATVASAAAPVVAGTTTAVAGGASAASAAPALAAMGPVGWGVGALLLAKQMKWI